MERDRNAPTMTMGEAAAKLRIPISRVRRMCRAYERDTSTGLAFTWTSEPQQLRDGRVRRGKRMPFVDAVEAYAQSLAKRRKSEPETMSMGDAAALLGVRVPVVRKWCESGDLAFEWTHRDMPRRDALGRELKGHRRPHADAVRALVERRAGKPPPDTCVS